MIAGVAAGVADFFGLNTSLIRAIWAITAIFGGMTILIYLIMWVVVPMDDGASAPPSPAQEEE